MNEISIFGKKLSKIEFFDFVYDTFIEANYAEENSFLHSQLNILYGILDCYGWTGEYRQWVADGAGANEAYNELRDLLEIFPVAS